MALTGRRIILLAMAAALGVGLLTAQAGQPAQAGPTMSPASSARSLDPSPLTNVLTGVSAVSAGDAWAVGYYVNTSGNTVDNTLILHWNGTAWSQVTSPSPGNNNYLWSVSAVSGSDAWAVGCTFANGVGHTLILHWNGTAWSQVTGPSRNRAAHVSMA